MRTCQKHTLLLYLGCSWQSVRCCHGNAHSNWQWPLSLAPLEPWCWHLRRIRVSGVLHWHIAATPVISKHSWGYRRIYTFLTSGTWPAHGSEYRRRRLSVCSATAWWHLSWIVSAGSYSYSPTTDPVKWSGLIHKKKTSATLLTICMWLASELLRQKLIMQSRPSGDNWVDSGVV